MKKDLLWIIFSLLLGIIGGIFGSEILWPYFVERPLLYHYRLNIAPVEVIEKRKIEIKEEKSLLKEIFSEFEDSTFFIKSDLKGKTISGSGFILTSDGIAVTLSQIIPPQSSTTVFFKGEEMGFQVLKRNEKLNLILIKLEGGRNYKTAGFVDISTLKFGERVFIIGERLNEGMIQKIINEGILKTVDNAENILETNIAETTEISGSPLFTFDGKFLGLSFLKGGRIFAIPATKIKAFAGIQ